MKPMSAVSRALVSAASGLMVANGAVADAADDYNVFKSTIGAGAVEVTWDGFVGQGPSPDFDPFVRYTAEQIGPSLPVVLDGGSSYAVSAVNFGFPGEFGAFSSSNTFAPIGRSSFTLTFAGGLGVTAFGVMFSDVEKVNTTYVRGFDASGNELTTGFAPLGPNTQTGTSGSNSGFSFASIVSPTPIHKVEINLGNCWVTGAYGFQSAGNTGCPRVIFGGAYVYDGVVMDNMVFSTPVPEPAALSLAALGLGVVGAATRRRRVLA